MSGDIGGVFDDLQYRVYSADGNVTGWKPMPNAVGGVIDFLFPSQASPEGYHVLKMEVRELPPWPGPGWYGPAMDEKNNPIEPTELKWCTTRGEVPEGWWRWLDTWRIWT